MQVRTQVIIGATLVLLGLGVVALGYLDDEAQVRQVADVLADPEGHQSGSFTLIGIPQPEQLVSLDHTEPNPNRLNATAWISAWDGKHTTHRIEVVQDATGSAWTYTNTTQEAGRPTTAVSTNETWRIEGSHTIFLIQGFPDANGDTPWLWGVYEGVLREPVQPKPSQFEGRLATELGSTPLPAGAWVFTVDEFTAGCSSKFLPEDHEADAEPA